MIGTIIELLMYLYIAAVIIRIYLDIPGVIVCVDIYRRRERPTEPWHAWLAAFFYTLAVVVSNMLGAWVRFIRSPCEFFSPVDTAEVRKTIESRFNR